MCGSLLRQNRQAHPPNAKITIRHASNRLACPSNLNAIAERFVRGSMVFLTNSLPGDLFYNRMPT